MGRRSWRALASPSGTEHGLFLVIVFPAASALVQPLPAPGRWRAPAIGPRSHPAARGRPLLPGRGELPGAGAGFLPAWVAALGQSGDGILRAAGLGLLCGAWL